MTVHLSPLDLKAEAEVRKIQPGKKIQDPSKKAGDLPISQQIPVCEIGKSRPWGGSVALLCTTSSAPRGAPAPLQTPGLPVLASRCSWPACHRGQEVDQD